MEEHDLGELWRHASAVLPDGWHLDALRCASAGLEAHGRSEDWVAVAINPEGAEMTARAPTPVEAIDALAASDVDGAPLLPNDVFELMWSELSGDDEALPYESKIGTLHIGAMSAELERNLQVWLRSPRGRTIRITFRPAATVEVDELEVPVADPRISPYVIATIDVLEDLAGALRAGTAAERARHIKNMADAERRAEEFRRRQVDERLDSL